METREEEELAARTEVRKTERRTSIAWMLLYARPDKEERKEEREERRGRGRPRGPPRIA
jgi:hypothetical protein